MPFVHGKNARVYIDAYDMSRYFQQADMMGKVEMADVTAFAPVPGVAVAKQVIPGVKDGQIQLKGFFDSTQVTTSLSGSTAGFDAYVFQLVSQETGSGAALTASNVEGIVSVAPTGSWAPGSRVWAASNVVANYQFAAPVKNAVTVAATMQADGGVNTGVSLKDPGVSDTFPTTYVRTAFNASTQAPLPWAAINTNGLGTYAASGQLLVPVSGGGYTIASYTGQVTSRTDTATVTNASSTVNDTSIVASDAGRSVSGTGIPAGSFVGTVTAGTSFVLVNSAGTPVAATAAGTSITLTPAFTGVTGGSGTPLNNQYLTPLFNGTGVNDLQLPQESTAGPVVAIPATQTLTAAPFALNASSSPITAGFPQSGQILVPISGSTVTITYSGISATQFLNCTGGGGQTTVAGNVTLAPISTVAGAYGFLHVNSVAGSTAGVLFAKLQHSDDNSTWTDVPGGAWTVGSSSTYTQGQYGSGQYGGGSISGGYILFIPPGTQILRYVRVVISYGSGATSSAVLTTFIRL